MSQKWFKDVTNLVLIIPQAGFSKVEQLWQKRPDHQVCGLDLGLARRPPPEGLRAWGPDAGS